MALPKLIYDPLSSFRQQEELPYRDTLDEYIDLILPDIRTLGEDLREEGVYLEESWLEFNDDEENRRVTLHFFREGSEYMQSEDGDISRGSWELMERKNYMILDTGNGTELYQLAFLNSDFFILRKHGNQSGFQTGKYLALGRENAMVNRETGGLYTWREYAEALSQVYQQKNYVIPIMIAIVVVLAFLIIWLQ